LLAERVYGGYRCSDKHPLPSESVGIIYKGIGKVKKNLGENYGLGEAARSAIIKPEN